VKEIGIAIGQALTDSNEIPKERCLPDLLYDKVFKIKCID
jgi:hypothetical protein